MKSLGLVLCFLSRPTYIRWPNQTSTFFLVEIVFSLGLHRNNNDSDNHYNTYWSYLHDHEVLQLSVKDKQGQSRGEPTLFCSVGFCGNQIAPRLYLFL